MRRPSILFPILVGLSLACSSELDRCLGIEPGTPIAALPSASGPNGCKAACAGPSSNALGTALFCCAGTADGGCGVDCATLPLADTYSIGGEYAGGTCRDADPRGFSLCGAWVADGKVLATFIGCTD